MPALRGVFGWSGFANDLSDIAMSPDGRHVYVAALERRLASGQVVAPRDSSLLAFVRNRQSGRLHQFARPRRLPERPSSLSLYAGRGITALRDLEVSRDGRFVYAAAMTPRSVAIFARDAASGTLHQLPGEQGYLVDGEGDQGCTNPRLTVNEPRIDFGINLRLSPDGRHLYLLGRALRRDTDLGTLAPPLPSTCPSDALDPACRQLP